MSFIISENSIPKPPPHVWEIVRDAYFNLYNVGSRQALIISGESGAGKTETTKKCLQFLSTIASSSSSSSSSSDKIGELAIEDKVINSNPLLESFGNAKTTRNNNSSRFGKWLEVSFVKSRENMILQGANITQVHKVIKS
jgi:myosin heavy subunit